jgi:anti-sigma regulatory factor (Ser/Thr protein kinase)
VAELTAALSEAVTAKDVVSVVAERVLPPFGADGLIVHTLEAGRLHIVGTAGYPQDFLDRHLEGRSLADNVAIADVLGNRAPRFVPSADEFIRRYPQLRHTVPPSGKNAWALLPLIASGQAMGSCAISFARPRGFTDEERTLLLAISGLIAQALERARLYDREHNRAQELQRGLLPRELPVLPAVSAAARYLPAGKGADVGGDWFDVIPLSADRVALVIGDVMGHGIAEAATMGRLRTAVRTLAELELAPDEVLGKLNGIVRDLGDDYFATCLYAVFDPVNGVCSFSTAGHPSPVVVRADGAVRPPDLPDNPPLGAAEPPFDVHELPMPTRSLLVFYTDGLIESATRDMDEGLAQLTRFLSTSSALAACFGTDGPHDDAGDARALDRLCDVITSTLLPDQEATSDDAALLVALTRHTAAADVASWPLPQDPRAAGQAREYAQRQLALWGLNDLADATELLVSELVGNAIRYARGPIRFRMIRSRSLICEVSDGSLTTPRIRRASATDEGGRGLQLVAALSQRWGTRYTGDGKCIWTEQQPTATA